MTDREGQQLGNYRLIRFLGKGNFADATYRSRIGPLTLKHSGWGLGLFDFHRADDAIALGAEATERALEPLAEALAALT